MIKKFLCVFLYILVMLESPSAFANSEFVVTEPVWSLKGEESFLYQIDVFSEPIAIMSTEKITYHEGINSTYFLKIIPAENGLFSVYADRDGNKILNLTRNNLEGNPPEVVFKINAQGLVQERPKVSGWSSAFVLSVVLRIPNVDFENMNYNHFEYCFHNNDYKKGSQAIREKNYAEHSVSINPDENGNGIDFVFSFKQHLMLSFDEKSEYFSLLSDEEKEMYRESLSAQKNIFNCEYRGVHSFDPRGYLLQSFGKVSKRVKHFSLATTENSPDLSVSHYIISAKRLED